LGPCLGKGAFAEVYQGIDTVTGKFMAVKQVTLKNESSNEARKKNVCMHTMFLWVCRVGG